MARRKHTTICSVARGEALGRREFKQGKMAIPAHSKRVRAALRHCSDMKATIKYLTAWSRGWHRANVAAPLGALPSWWPFGKKPAKRHPMSRTVYMMKTKSGSYIPVDRPPTHAMSGARRKRKRRR